MNNEIYSSRILNYPVQLVYRAFAEPDHLKDWWGPEGFSNTIHEFDLQPGGKWLLTMHGPEKGNYENSSVFNKIIPNELVSWKRVSQPLFDMEIGFERLENSQTRISFTMIFKTPEECNKIKNFAGPKNEENFDRLERVLLEMSKSPVK
ncbi:MAG: SRPBCC domain-containing protein [Flavobacteriales bacterium]|nr:SRPBCC domain-containing protein [Flavobacteriales bacterium]MCB9198689.1 SRPBCC domain-containing protein [Flavobacteriales bacterium]